MNQYLVQASHYPSLRAAGQVVPTPPVVNITLPAGCPTDFMGGVRQLTVGGTTTNLGFGYGLLTGAAATGLLWAIFGRKK